MRLPTQSEHELNYVVDLRCGQLMQAALGRHIGHIVSLRMPRADTIENRVLDVADATIAVEPDRVGQIGGAGCVIAVEVCAVTVLAMSGVYRPRQRHGEMHHPWVV